MFSRVRSRFTRAVTALALLLPLLAGCDPLAGDDGRDRDQSKGELRVGVMQTTDLAPLHHAIDQNYFEDEGLGVDTVLFDTSDQATHQLIGGEVDLTYSSYPNVLQAQAKDAAHEKGGLRIVAEAASASPDSCVVLAMPNSSVKTLKDLAGKRVAVTTPTSMGAVLVRAQLAMHSHSPLDIEFVNMPFAQMGLALKSGDVDAAFAVEPFIQEISTLYGAYNVGDVAQRETDSVPVAGFAATGDFVTDHPDKVAAFQRAMQRSRDELVGDRGTVEKLIVDHSDFSPDVAAQANIFDFQSKIDDTRLGRVLRLMTIYMPEFYDLPAVQPMRGDGDAQKEARAKWMSDMTVASAPYK